MGLGPETRNALTPHGGDSSNNGRSCAAGTTDGGLIIIVQVANVTLMGFRAR